MDTCVQQYTPFTCWSTHGYPPPPTYSWTQYSTGMTGFGTTYYLNDLGIHTLGCAAVYYHPECPYFYADCYANRTVTVFRQYT